MTFGIPEVGEERGFDAAGTEYPYALNLSASFTPDLTAPDIRTSVDPVAIDGDNGWYRSDVGVSFTVDEPGSPLIEVVGCDSTTVDQDTADRDITCTATSGGGTARRTATVKRDATAPTATLVGGPADGASYVFGSVPASGSCTASDGLSGPEGCTVTGYSAAVGTHTLTATARDGAGNTGTRTATYRVTPWSFAGYEQPVDMGGIVNVIKGGSRVPLRFRLFAGGSAVTSISAVQMTAARVTCQSGVPNDDLTLVTTGGTSFRYDSTFIYNWQTPRTPGACCAVTARSSDKSTLTASFLTR